MNKKKVEIKMCFFINNVLETPINATPVTLFSFIKNRYEDINFDKKKM